jgi:hypothetical protein
MAIEMHTMAATSIQTFMSSSIPKGADRALLRERTNPEVLAYLEA